MKRILIASITAAAFCGASALAAAAAPAPMWSWTGFYVGGNVGYGVARNPTGSTNPGQGSTETFTLSPQGALGGGQVGFNWQAAPNWILGTEADIQASAQRDSSTCVLTCTGPVGGVFTKVSQNLPWFGTLRGRLGWTDGPALYYLTGGWAFGQVTTNVAARFSPVGDVSGSFSDNLSGWTVGGGIEVQIAGNWTAKVEYLYVDLGSVMDSIRLSQFGNPPFTALAESIAIRNHIARIGLNYRFGT